MRVVKCSGFGVDHNRDNHEDCSGRGRDNCAYGVTIVAWYLGWITARNVQASALRSLCSIIFRAIVSSQNARNNLASGRPLHGRSRPSFIESPVCLRFPASR